MREGYPLENDDGSEAPIKALSHYQMQRPLNCHMDAVK